MMHPARAVRACFPPLERARIENLACSAPSAAGLEVTHWSARTLQSVVAGTIVTSIHYTSIAIILRQADLQPHHSRHWKTTVWDEEAIQRAASILWYYERIDWLWSQGIAVVCLDEKPNLQVLERAAPAQLMQPGQIERQEFEYHRHGTVNLLAGMTLHDGHMWSTCLERNDGAHFRPALEQCLDHFTTYSGVKRFRVILDGGPSHTATDTQALYQARQPEVRVLFTPAHASWLNQAELLLGGFSSRYLKRGSWSTADEMIAHLAASTREYNDRFAHRFSWSWTRPQFHDWLDARAESIQCET